MSRDNFTVATRKTSKNARGATRRIAAGKRRVQTLYEGLSDEETNLHTKEGSQGTSQLFV
jgi:hypothetical protein